MLTPIILFLSGLSIGICGTLLVLWSHGRKP